MICVSDRRALGTAYGTVVLHVALESAVGGPLALLKEGDWIMLDVEARSLNMEASADALAQRRPTWKPSVPVVTRSYAGVYVQRVLQADCGVDLDILVGCSKPDVYREPRQV